MALRRYWLLCAALAAAMLAVFALAEALGVPVLTDDDPLPRQRGALLVAVAGVALLAADVVLPVPSSVVMVTHGAVFGAVAGTALSMAGSLAGFAAGFALGRRGTAVVARLVPDDERRRADRFLRRWGPVAVILSRPVPVLAETVSVVAGTSGLPWPRAVAAAALGTLPAAGVYAVAGAAAAGFATTAVVFLAVLVLAAGAALAVARRRPAGGGAPA